MSLVSEILLSTPRLHVGVFRCSPRSELWRRENRSGDYPLVVFPRTAVEIHQADRASVVATPVHAMLYNAAQPYRRDLIDPRGDACEFFCLKPELLEQVFQSLGRPLPDPTRPFPFAFTPCTNRVYLNQRRLFMQTVDPSKLQALGRFESTEPSNLSSTALTSLQSQLEEDVLLLLPDLINEAFRFHDPFFKPRRAKHVAAQWDLVQAAKDFIARNLGRRLTTDDIAQYLDCSVFHLCRLFKQLTGQTIHQFILQFRLRAAAERVLETQDSLTDIALDFSFANHSHFTNTFRQRFGCAPSKLRGRSNQ